MGSTSSIEWTEATWNPVTGCTKISIGCMNCYAERMAKRLQAMHHPSYTSGFNLSIHEQLLPLPLQWKQPRKIFVNSMSDLFHSGVPDIFIVQAFQIMKSASWHTFQILTKRSDKLKRLNPLFPWSDNIWVGVSVESPDFLNRIDDLKTSSARIKFISFEPLLAPIEAVNLKGIDWVIVGGESGPKARPMKEAWAKDIRDICIEQEIPFFFKQWGGFNKKKNGRLLDGRLWDADPQVP